jgi:hypothetical protein
LESFEFGVGSSEKKPIKNRNKTPNFLPAVGRRINNSELLKEGLGER